MKIYMVRYFYRGSAQKAVEAESKEDAIEKYDSWKETREDSDKYSKAHGAYELDILK